MGARLETRDLAVVESASPVSFERVGPPTNPDFDRYLLLDGNRAYHVGNVCDTCEFVFQRLEGANDKLSPSGLGERFRHGIATLDDQLLRTVESALPVGEYKALLLELTPSLVQPGDAADYFTHEQVDLWGMDRFWNLTHNPRTEYYRGACFSLGDGRQFFEFAVPMMPSNWLDSETAERYKGQLQAGERPTAFAVSVLDVKQPANWEGDPAVTEHWCLAHYILDGHHKMLAASRTQRPVQVLSFLAMTESVATAEEIQRAIDALSSAPG